MTVELGAVANAENLLQAQVEKLVALSALSAAVANARDADETYAAALDCLEQTLAPDRSSVLLFDEDGVLRFKAWRGLSDTYRQATEGHSPWSPETRNPEPVLVASVDEEPSLASLRDAIAREGIRALGFFPLVARERLLGKFMVYYDAPHVFTPIEIRLAQAIGAHIALELSRAATEEELRFKTSLLEAQSELAQDGILAVSPGRRMISFNRAFVEMWRIPPEVVAGGSDETAMEAVREQLVDPDEFAARVAHLYAHPDETSNDEIRLKDGRVFDRYSAPVRDGRGSYRGRVWFFSDATGRAQVERDHSLAERRRRVTETLAQAVSEDDVAETIVREGTTSLGARTVWIGVLDAEGTELRQLAAAGHGTETTPAIVPLALVHPSVAALQRRQPLWLGSRDEILSSFPAFGEVGLASDTESLAVIPLLVAQHAIGVVAFEFAEPRDFPEDERRLLVALAGQSAQAVERTRLHRQLAERANAASVLAHVGDGVFQLDPDGRITIWNQGAEVITGVPETDAVGALIDEVFAGWDAIASRISITAIPLAFGRRQALPVEVSGRELWLAISGVASGEGTVYAFRDVTESEELEQTRRDLLATVSHELRTPLSAVFGAAKTLRHREVDDAQRDTLLAIVDSETERLGRILDDLLVAARLDERRLELSLAGCNLVELAHEVVENERPRLPRETILTVEAGRSVPPAECDRDKVRQVLLNLVDNAIKYSPGGGRIAVSVERRAHGVRLSVADEGLGIPHDRQSLVFDKFYRLDPQLTRGVGGTGLGLYISREFVERMNGRIWVESSPGVGSTFHVELPVHR